MHVNNYWFSDVTFRIEFCDGFTINVHGSAQISSLIASRFYTVKPYDFSLEKQTQILSLEINFPIYCRKTSFVHSDSMATIREYIVRTQWLYGHDLREYIGITICMHHCS